ncbi:YARHG domain-containing protein [Brasilonema sp. UFV-L1]|uniref:protein kinase domain-containing protein n=1 Tax=Brasilonema sp. UFV-L1 TaxID=2234130 RepID=UPI00145FB3ED|nr:YARHG domain-containing protein [Brasilonema sp. UFV-L1]NMG08793.1 serine/threonine protein kinase [Brasilonema sp. UFV-L1]
MSNLLNNRYRIICSLGSGGFGETFLAEDTQMPSLRRCVIKQLKPIHNNPQIYQLVQERFQREAAILENLGESSQQIPVLYAFFQSNGLFYLVQEYIEGNTLTAKVKQQGVFSESAVRELLLTLLPILEYIHSRHIVHRDIKPDNIILRDRDQKPVLIDFGAVRETMGTVINSQGSLASSIIIGTPGYMPSEQAMGRPVYVSDLYSLGITIIYLLTGKQPQELEINPQTGEIVWHPYILNISPTMIFVIDKAIAYHPRDRFASAREMLQALQGIPNTILPPTQPPSTQPPTVSTPSPETVTSTPSLVRSHSQNRILIGSVIAGGLIGASIIIGLVLTKSSQQPVAKQTTSFIPSENLSSLPTSASEKTNPQFPKVSTPAQSNTNSNSLPSSFYFLADSAFANSQTAAQQVKNLQAAGYPEAGMFWIPEYPNLSDQQLFEVYTAIFSERNNCLDLLRTYGQVNSKAYCAFASKNPNSPPDRFYFKQISTSSTPPLTSVTPLVTTKTANNYSWLSQRLVTDKDLDGKNGFELDIMRNSIFAHHGRRFDTAGLQQYFNKQPWYRPLYSPKDFPTNLLSNTEQQNVEYIAQYQDRYNRRFFSK